jgi:hypothetical protein
MPENPFEVLRLDPAASEEEVVRQAGRLRQRATDEAALNAIRQAVQALTGRPEDRRLHALLTHPAPAYHSAALDRFAAAFRRPPQAAAPGPCPPLDFQEFQALFYAQVCADLEMTPSPFEPVSGEEEPDEVRRQTAEVLWQSLLFDPRA